MRCADIVPHPVAVHPAAGDGRFASWRICAKSEQPTEPALEVCNPSIALGARTPSFGDEDRVRIGTISKVLSRMKGDAFSERINGSVVLMAHQEKVSREFESMVLQLHFGGTAPRTELREKRETDVLATEFPIKNNLSAPIRVGEVKSDKFVFLPFPTGNVPVGDTGNDIVRIGALLAAKPASEGPRRHAEDAIEAHTQL